MAYREIIHPHVLRLIRLSGDTSKQRVRGLGKILLDLCKLIPGADVIFLGIFFKEIKMYVLHPFHLSESCGGMFWEWMYDVYVTYLIVTGFVIYLIRRYYLSRKRS